MPLKPQDLRKVTFPSPSEDTVELINSYFAKKYLDKPYEGVLAKLEIALETEGYDRDWLDTLYDRWEAEQPPK